MAAVKSDPNERSWWKSRRPFTRSELAADGIIHAIGLLISLIAGTVLVVFAAQQEMPEQFLALVIYVATLVLVLSISLAFNLWPLTPIKRILARLDQAAIFLFIAGTYTPVLAYLGASPSNAWLLGTVWAAALCGMALKLAIPHLFGRVAILLYLGIGASGVLVFQTLAANLSPTALWLMIAGGVTYAAGIVFHVNDRIPFHNAIWHGFVVAAATMHLAGFMELFVLARL